MADRLRVAVIGMGAMGGNHARVYSELPDAELVAVADCDESRLSDAPARAYGDYHRLLAEERLDAVSIAVPTRRHLETALACIERGVPLLVEKPLAASVVEGERIRAAAEARGVPLAAGHIERCNPAVVELKRRLDAGEIGRVLQMRAVRVGPFHQRHRDIGVVYDLATHDIDVMRHLLGCEVERARAETQRGVRTEFEDALLGLLRFEDGVIGSLEVNWLTPVKQRTLAVVGENGMFVADYIRQELRFYDSTPDPDPSPSKDAANTTHIEAERQEPLRVERQEPLRVELAAFLRASRELEPPLVGAADAIAAMRVAEALVASARLGDAVQVPVGEAGR